MRIVDELTALLDAERGFNGTGDPYMDQLHEQQLAVKLLDKCKEIELDLRLKCFAGAFPNPREGTNMHKLPDGRELKGVHKINRYIEEAALAVTLDAMREKGVANADQLVRYKPELAKAEWNTLSDEMKLLFSPAIVATPGTPSFDVVTPKRRGRQG